MEIRRVDRLHQPGAESDAGFPADQRFADDGAGDGGRGDTVVDDFVGVAGDRCDDDTVD